MKHFIVLAIVSCGVAAVGCTSQVSPVDAKGSDDPQTTALRVHAEEVLSKVPLGEDGRAVVPADAVPLGSRTAEQFTQDYASSMSGPGSRVSVDMIRTCVNTFTTETCCVQWANATPICCIVYSSGYGHCPV